MTEAIKTRKAKTAVAVIPEQVKEVASVETLIAQAIEKGASIETLEKILAMREKLKAEVAKSAFVSALSNFQSEVQSIKKNKRVLNKDMKTVRYMYASIDSIVDQIRPSLGKNGLSYTFDVKNETGFMTAVATVTHKLGYSQTSEFKVPIDPEGYMTAPQKYASALTFAKRYALCNALGISTGDEDTDATDVGKEKDVKSVKAKIVMLLKGLGEKLNSEEGYKLAVKKHTQLELVEDNYEEIASRLQIKLDEKNEG